MSFVDASKLANDCLSPWHSCVVDLVCGIVAKCFVHDWWGHMFVVDCGSHSWHVHPSTKMTCYIGVGEGGSMRGSIGGSVHIVGGWGLWSRLPQRGIVSMGSLVLIVLLAYP